MLEGATFRRIHACRLLARFPQVKERLLDGRLFMTTLVQLEEVLTDDNADELFAAASGKSKTEVAYLVACCKVPKSDVVPDAKPAATIRKLAAPRALFVSESAAPIAPVIVLEPQRRPEPIVPVAEDRFKIQLTVGKAFVDLVEEAKVVLSHRVPSGEIEGVLRAALEDLIAREAKRNAPKVAKKVVGRGAPSPQPPPSGRGSRMTIPSAIRREVWARDKGRCVWKKADGTCCGSRWRIQLDHILAVARGGESTVENLRLLCADHNAQHAREDFGEEHMRAVVTSAGGSRSHR